MLSFIESPLFAHAWKSCGLSDADLFELQSAVMANPKGWPVIKGTGGVRKLRFSPASILQGKSGAYRVLYVYFEEYDLVLLVTAYPKSKMEDVSPSDRRVIRQMVEFQYEMLARRQTQ